MLTHVRGNRCHFIAKDTKHATSGKTWPIFKTRVDISNLAPSFAHVCAFQAWRLSHKVITHQDDIVTCKDNVDWQELNYYIVDWQELNSYIVDLQELNAFAVDWQELNYFIIDWQELNFHIVDWQ